MARRTVRPFLQPVFVDAFGVVPRSALDAGGARDRPSSSMPSFAHQRAVLLPEAADRRLAGAERLRFRVVAAHHDHAARRRRCIAARAARSRRRSRPPSRCIRAAPIRLPCRSRRSVIASSSCRSRDGSIPVRYLSTPARPDHPHRDGVAHLLQHHAGEHRQDLHRHAVAVFIDRLHHRAVLQLELAVRTQRGRLVVRVLGRVVQLGVADSDCRRPG